MTQYSCRSCREWYDKSLGACPNCAAGQAEYNSWLATAKMNDALWEQARQSQPKAQHEMYYREIRKDLDRLVREY